jgi:SAM-dependent methyltransferase
MEDKFYEDYFEFIMRTLGKLGLTPKTVLEIACGTGKLAKIFLDKGYSIEGLDISRSMLTVAKKKGLKVYQGNMVDFELNKKYDLILCIFDSLNYIQEASELQQCFKSVNKHLNQDGLFIFDMNSDFKINKIIPDFKTEYYKVGDIETVWLNSHETDTWISEMIFFEKTKDGKYVRFCEKHIEKAHKIGIVRKLVKKADFEIVESHSDFQFSKIRRNSKRWFFICKRRK